MPEPNMPAAGFQRNSTDKAAGQSHEIRVAGTQPPTWLPIAAALQSVLGAAGARLASEPLHGSDPGPDDAARVRTIAFVDSPARALAQWLASGTAGTSTDVLKIWRDSALQLLQRMYRDSEHCLLIDAAEAAAAPDALMRTVARWCSVSITQKRPAVASMTPPDSLGIALAQYLCSDDAACTELFEELHAASAVLVDNTATRPAAPAGEEDPVRRFRELLVAEVENKRRVQQGPQASVADASKFEAELADQRQECERLLLQLHRVQEQLERYYQEQKAREDAADRFGWRSAWRYDPQAVRLLGQHKQPPHLHLHFALEGVRSGTRRLPLLEVRLLDHLGRPGIAIFSTPSNEALASWQATGNEAGRPFMALIPSEPRGRLLLERMGTADWQLVNHLAHAIQRAVGDEGLKLGQRWQVTAARLCRQLDEMPPRLRYDRLQLRRAESDGEQPLDVLFGRVSYGDRLLEQIHLRWQVAGSGGKADTPRVRWLRPEDATDVPLAAWPVGDDGLFAPAFALPVGFGSDARQQRRQWAAMSAADRALVLAVLDALPGAAERAPDSSLPDGADPASLAREAAVLHKEGRRNVTANQLRELVRRIVRRLGGGR